MNDNDKIKVIKKLLMGYSFEMNGYKYRFISIEPDDKGWSYDIVVDVNLPVKGQSYATPIFSNHIHEILSNIWKYVDFSFSYSEKILVDGEEPVKNSVFINVEKQMEILHTMRKEIKEVTLRTAIGPLTFDVYWKPWEKFYSLDDVYIDFNFNIEIKNFLLSSHHVVPNLKIADDVTGAILNVMYDSDSLRDEVNNVIYDVMGNEIDISNVDDLYYQGRFFITKIDGFEVNERFGNHYDLEDGMFI